jgi:uncharacterized protein YecA (UPF0149 family)
MEDEDFRRDLRRTLADPSRMAAFERDRIAPFTDAIGTLGRWHHFSEEARRAAAKQDFDDVPDGLTEPVDTYVNPNRHVGRNDPCPCGSGKKYKKCCLGKAVTP